MRFRKTLWKKVKLLRMSDFMFSHNVFYAICILESFNPFPNKPWFLRVCSASLLKTQWEKEKLLVTSNFSFSHSVFYPYGELSAIFIEFEIVICEFFQFRKVEKVSFGKGLIATFQLSSAASLNLGRSQNGVIGNRLKKAGKKRQCMFLHCNLCKHTEKKDEMG